MLQRNLVTIFLFVLMSVVVGCASKKNSGGKGANDLSELNLDLPVKKYTLDNGLRLLVVENNRLPIVSYYTFFDVGGRFESREAGTTGATHFLEHMMFKGAKKYKAGDFEKIVEGNGGRGNAYTTFDSTVYYESFPTKVLDKIIDIEADRMGNLTIDPKALKVNARLSKKKERRVTKIVQLVNCFWSMMQSTFKGSPLRW